jgi:hypothetical protein
MQIGKYNLEFTTPVQEEFVRQNEAELIKNIKFFMDKQVFSHNEAVQVLADYLSENHGISIDTSLLRSLDVWGE